MQSQEQNKQTLTALDLAQFTGSEQFFRHSLNRSVLYTEGAQYLAAHAGAPIGFSTKSPSPNPITQP
jgi:hypothetical protein